MKSILRLAAAQLTLLVASATLVAQDTKAKPGESEFPTDQHKRLNPLVGNWDVAIRFKVGPDKFQDSSASCETKWILDGHVLRQEYNSMMNGKPYTVIHMLGYSDQKKKFFEIKFDNMNNYAMVNEGAISDDSKVITQVGERIDPATGKSGKLRTVTTLTDNDHYTLEWFLIGSDGKEEKGVTLVHTRKKP